ncbi:MAG: thymidine phosphorylase [Oligoflexia bacterium]|nr:thymidine phosphorylase [Oligoflexia bacterium]
MIPAEIIKKKRNGQKLSESEIKFFIHDYMMGNVADYQMSAFLMATYFSGMDKKETLHLTNAMLHSGSVINFENKVSHYVDKHSTGGVGDKTSLIIAPIVAVCGLKVPMISGRGLGHTGGTLDKLESIPGFNVWFDLNSFKTLVNSVGACFIGQTKEICPADKKMYALRDVTATVESIPLICASIMSKKLAEGIDSLVLDVKTGSGAFMKTMEDSIRLARALIEVGKLSGKKMVAVISNMAQPLGYAVGNSLEVEECLDVLSGSGPEDLKNLSIELAAQMLLIGKKTKNIRAAKKLALNKITDGTAMNKFLEIIKYQGGDIARLPKARSQMDFRSSKSGYIQKLDAEKVGIASLTLGAGRLRTEDKIDPSCGILLHKKVGDSVVRGEVLATVYYNNDLKLKSSLELLNLAYVIGSKKVSRPKLVFKVLK